VLKILLEHCRKVPTVEVLFEHKVVKAGQDEEKAWVDVERPGQEELKRFEDEYVVGCDGASSRVRQELFGKEWPGVTWEHTLLVQNVSAAYLACKFMLS
jgi:2-polyprenyl-6-methoxyphenol hydroxylase-like FAD-dependent oxidoreductase